MESKNTNQHFNRRVTGGYLIKTRIGGGTTGKLILLCGDSSEKLFLFLSFLVIQKFQEILVLISVGNSATATQNVLCIY